MEGRTDASAARLVDKYTDLDLEHLQSPAGKRLEVVADGLPLFSVGEPLRSDGARRRVADFDGVPLEAARRRKART